MPSVTVKALTHSLVFTSWCLAAAASAQESPANKSAKEKLQGRWLTVEGEATGKSLDKSVIGKQVYEFKGDVLIVENNSVALGAAKFTIDDNKKPFEMDIVVGSLGTNPAIFRFGGERLRICMDKPGGKRPTEFKTSPGTMQKMFAFERAAVAVPAPPPAAIPPDLAGRWRAVGAPGGDRPKEFQTVPGSEQKLYEFGREGRK